MAPCLMCAKQLQSFPICGLASMSFSVSFKRIRVSLSDGVHLTTCCFGLYFIKGSSDFLGILHGHHVYKEL